MRRLLVLPFLLCSCTHVVVHNADGGSTEVWHFGAGEVRATGVEAESPGISEGFTEVLVKLPEAALRVFGGMMTGAGAGAGTRSCEKED